MNTLQLGQTYSTRDGKGTGRVVADDLSSDHKFCVVVTHDGTTTVGEYKADGTYSYASNEDWFLIIPERKMRTVYVNGFAHANKEDAVAAAFACRRANVHSYDIEALPVEVPAE